MRTYICNHFRFASAPLDRLSLSVTNDLREEMGAPCKAAVIAEVCENGWLGSWIC